MTGASITTETSIRGGEQLIRRKGLYQDLMNIVEEIAPIQGSNATDKETQIQRVLDDFGWDHTSTPVANYNRPQFDGMKLDVALEHEAREQMNVRSHLLFLEAAFREGKSECAVMIIPQGEDAKVGRIEKEAMGEGKLFTYHFPLFTPLFLIEYVPS